MLQAALQQGSLRGLEQVVHFLRKCEAKTGKVWSRRSKRSR